MKSKNTKTKKSKITVLKKCGMVFFGLIFSGFVLAQIPYNQGKVYVCPLAKSMEGINPKCECRIDLILGETVTSTCDVNGKTYEMTLTTTEQEGKEYFAILGFESGGAGVNFSPEAKISAPFEGFVGENILFDGSGSFDKNGDPLSFFWDFGDKILTQGEKVFHSFENPGEYLITLKVSDGMDDSFSTFTLKILPSQSLRGGKVTFYEKKETKETIEIEKEKTKTENEPKEKEITSKEKLEKPKEKETQKITKTLNVEKREKEKEKEKGEGEMVLKEKETREKEKKVEHKIQTQNFPSLLFASLKETILNPKVFLFLIFSAFVLIIILTRKIKPRLK